MERKRLLIHTLKLHRERRNDSRVVWILGQLSDASRHMGLHDQGIRTAKEALEILERSDDTVSRALGLTDLAWLYHDVNQLDAAEEAASRAIDLTSKEDKQNRVCACHRLLGRIPSSSELKRN